MSCKFPYTIVQFHMLTEGAMDTRDIDHIHKLLHAFHLKAHSYLLLSINWFVCGMDSYPK